MQIVTLGLMVYVFVGIANAMKAYQSILPLHDETADAGLQIMSNTSKKLTDFSMGFTICGRFNYRRLGIDTVNALPTVLEIISPQKEDGLMLSMCYFRTFFILRPFTWVLKDEQKNSYQIWTPDRWSNLCLSFDTNERMVLFVKDGMTISKKVEPKFKTDILSTTMLENMAFGKRVKDAKGSSQHAGMISDINVWDFPLTEQNMQDWTSCKSNKLNGNIIDWITSQWMTTNMHLVDIDQSSLCKADTLGLTLIPERLNAFESVNLCHKLNGKLFTIKDQASMNTAINISFAAINGMEHCSHPEHGEHFWAGWTDELIEGLFTDMNHGHLQLNVSKFDSGPWTLSEPNGNDIENCAMYNNKGLLDINCISFQACSVCTIEELRNFKLRGIESSVIDDKPLFDLDYAWTGELHGGKYSLRGFSISSISFDSDSGSWILSSKDEPIGRTLGNVDNYPFGINDWQIQNQSHKLSLASCNGNEFNCADGTCVNLTQRCDGAMDCKDQSDEWNCHKIKKARKDFNVVNKPPSASKGQKVQILCHVAIVNILDMNEVLAKMSLQLKVTIEWTDPRMDFLNLKDDEYLNALTDDEKRDIWMPELIFARTEITQLAQFKNMTEKASFGFVKINPGAKSMQNPVTELHMGYRHAGKDCTIVVMDYFKVDFIYNYQMNKYPFDSQKFQAFLVLPKEHRGFVELVPGNISYMGPKDMMKYIVQSYRLDTFEDMLLIEIVLGRQIMNEILTTILPTVIIVLVSFTTNHYGNDHFEAIVTVNLTALLVMATLFISVFSSLPRTSAIKMIDIWLICTLFIPFMEVILHTKMKMMSCSLHDLKEKLASCWTHDQVEKRKLVEKTEREIKNLKRLRNIAMYGLPITALLFLVGFFLVGFLVV